MIVLGPGQPLAGPDLEAVAEAARQGKPVAFPTDTVYGIGCAGMSQEGVRRICQLKGRDALKPLPILIDSKEAVRRWVEWTPAAEALASRYWPGPLTLVLKPTKEGRLLTSQEFPTLAIRVPAHPVALALLRACGVPLAVTSANLSGRPALAWGAEVARALGGQVEYVVDGGRVSGTESTVADVSGGPIRVLREGALSLPQLVAAAAGAS
ncbi:MAG: threonylcarbamoyl-AMP synthase [Elusimicrobia bacterium]|nr:threonylcarbamoyl-AMP synthase [Elusimicrobiota bacterium]